MAAADVLIIHFRKMAEENQGTSGPARLLNERSIEKTPRTLSTFGDVQIMKVSTPGYSLMRLIASYSGTFGTKFSF